MQYLNKKYIFDKWCITNKIMFNKMQEVLRTLEENRVILLKYEGIGGSQGR